MPMIPKHMPKYEYYGVAEEANGVTLNHLISYAEHYGLSLDTPIYCQHVEDSYLADHQSAELLVPGDEKNYGCYPCGWGTESFPCEYANECKVYIQTMDLNKEHTDETPDCCKRCPERNQYLYGESVSYKGNRLLINLHY